MHITTNSLEYGSLGLFDPAEKKKSNTDSSFLDLINSNKERNKHAADAVESVAEDKVDKDRKPIGLTSVPVTKDVSVICVASLPKESTPTDPIVQVDWNEEGEHKTYNVHVNKVDPESATDLEMFAFLSYQGHIGNKIPGAINNWSAYKSLKESEMPYASIDAATGQLVFVESKVNAKRLVNTVYGWMSRIANQDAKMQAHWCECLLDMFKDAKGNKR